jgi:hypothetical protein
MCGSQLSNSRAVVTTSAPRQVKPIPGARRALAVAAHLRVQNRDLVQDYSEYSALGLPGVADSLQAGAAATEALANMLEAAVAGDREAFYEFINRFVNDAVDTGVVKL